MLFKLLIWFLLGLGVPPWQNGNVPAPANDGGSVQTLDDGTTPPPPPN